MGPLHHATGATAALAVVKDETTALGDEGSDAVLEHRVKHRRWHYGMCMWV